jgi:hypothetical protein
MTYELIFVTLLLCFTSIITSSPELITYATELEHEDLAMLQRTARWHGWSPLHVIGTQEGFNTHGLVDKLRALRRFARRWPDETILVFVDGYDVVINNEPAVLESAFLASGKRVLLASELGCCTDKQTALKYRTHCHSNWPFAHVIAGRMWLNSGVIVGYARDIRRLLRMAWKEYRSNPPLYHAYTDQQLLCFLVSDGSNIWTRAAIGIDHMSEVALTTYQTDVRIGHVLRLDDLGRIVFSNRTVPPIIHFNGPKNEKAFQMKYAKANFPLLQNPIQ